MFIAIIELHVAEDYRQQFEDTFPDSMRATLPGVEGLRRATLLAPTESGQGYLATLEFVDEAAYQTYLHSEAFHSAHPWPGRVPLEGTALTTTYTTHTDMTSELHV